MIVIAITFQQWSLQSGVFFRVPSIALGGDDVADDGIDKLLGLEREVQRSQGVAHDLLPQLIIVILLLHPQREVALVEERSLEDALNTRGLLHTHKNVLSTQELFNQRHTSSLETFGGR